MQSVRRDAAASCVVVFVLASAGLAQQTTCVSLAPGGVIANGDSAFASMSSDGRLIGFASFATDLVAGDTNDSPDVFVHDRASNATWRVSVASDGTQANGASLESMLSADGHWIAFVSRASNLVGHDTNSVQDVFVYELATATTTRISVSSAGAQASEPSFAPAISGDGRLVVFHSSAPDLVASDTNGVADVFLCDVVSGTMTRVSLSSAGAQANGASARAALSTDGRFVAFDSVASNLVQSDTNGDSDVFVRDLTANTTTRVSTFGTGLGAQVEGASYEAALSSDGRFVAFASESAQLVSNDLNNAADVFVFDRQLGTRERVSIASDGGEGAGWSHAPSISSNGQRVVFETDAPNLLAETPYVRKQVVMRNRANATTQQLSVASNGQPADSVAERAIIAPDGQRVVFESGANNLIPGDGNSAWDVFVRDFTLSGSGPEIYCTAGTSKHGCVASIAASGAASASAASGFTLAVSNVEGQRQAIFFYGVGGQVAWPWADTSSSFICMKSPLQRFAPQNSGGTFFACDGTLAVDWNAWRASATNALGAPFAAGDEAWAQAWYRDPGAPKNTSLSDAVHFFVGP